MSPLIYQRLILYQPRTWSKISLIHHHDHGKSFPNQNYVSSSGHEEPTTMCDIPKNSEKWVESKYVKSERLGIVPGTWFGKRVDVRISNILFHDILYTVGFVKMRRIQRYYFYYVNRVGKRPAEQNTVFFRFGTMLMMLWLCNRSFHLKDMKFWIQWYWFHVNPSRTDGGMNILPVFCNIKTGEMFISPWILLRKIWFWYC